jgi:hypothetical protein
MTNHRYDVAKRCNALHGLIWQVENEGSAEGLFVLPSAFIVLHFCDCPSNPGVIYFARKQILCLLC